MAVNRTKILEAAQKFLSKGQYDKAVVEYQKLVHEDPRDVRTLLKIGDLHTRRNRPKDAIEVYQKVADLYAKQGFFLKAVAVYKQILKLDPAHLDSTVKLAKMYEELALTSDALATYELVADAYVAQGQMPKALETMQRMIELDGQNVAIRIKHAEALSKAGKPKEAAQAFAAGAELLKEQGRMDDYVRVVERQLYHDPENVQIARELARLYIERSDPKRALAKLQTCFKADPRDIQTLEMLAEAFRQLGQHPKTISVLKEIARLHGEAGSEEPRRRALRRVLDLDPNDAEAKQAVQAQPAPPTPKSVAAARPTAAPPPRRQAQQPPPPPPAMIKASPPPAPHSDEIELEEAEDLDLVEDEESDDVLIVDEPTAAPVAADPAPFERRHAEARAGAREPSVVETRLEEREPAAPPTLESRVLALLADADGREGAGDYEGAVAALQGVLELQPDHAAAHERLKDIYLAADRRVDAVKELLWLSSSWEDHSQDRAIQYAEAAYKLAPRSEATRRRLSALGVSLHEERVRPAAEPPHAGRSRDALDAELDAILPPLEDTEVGGFAPQDAVDLLELPIRPEDFDAAPPPPRAQLPNELNYALLEHEVSPEEFDAPRANGMRQRELGPASFDPSLRAAPLPSAWGVEPARAPGAKPGVEERADARERNDLDASAEERSEIAPPSAEFAPVGTSELSTPPPLAPDEPTPVGGVPTPGWGDAELLLVRPSSRAQAREDAAAAPLTSSSSAVAEAKSAPQPGTSRAPFSDLLLHDGEPARSASPSLAKPPSAPAHVAPSERPVQPVQPESGARELPASAEPIPVEIEEVLDEAEFFAAQGLFDEALEVVQEAILIYPASGPLKRRLAEYEAAQEAREQASADPHDDESFDIAEQLAGELVEVDAAPESDDLIDVESVFAQFKKGVAEQIAPDDAETHFDLGIAYKEMGLLDDAMNEFELATKSQKRACTALTMIGMCQLERGDAPLAISYFERALQSEQRGEAEELALHYEIGAVHERMGQLDRALAAFEQVAAHDRTFRGVAAKLDQLRKRGAKPARVSR